MVNRRKPTQRQMDYLRLALFSYNEMANELIVSPATARSMCEFIKKKYGAATKETALFLAILLGDIDALDIKIPMKTERIG